MKQDAVSKLASQLTDEQTEALAKIFIIARVFDWCGARKSGWGCTLQKGHIGPHAAHGEPDRVYTIWPRDTDD